MLHSDLLFQRIDLSLHFFDDFVFVILRGLSFDLIVLALRRQLELLDSLLELSILSDEMLHDLLIHIVDLPSWRVVDLSEGFWRCQRARRESTWPAVNLLGVDRLATYESASGMPKVARPC